MKAGILSLFILIGQQLWAQEFSRKFGQVSEAEIHLTEYGEDPDAGAVILFDMGESIFFEQGDWFNIRFTRSKRIKIFDKSAVDYAEIAIPYYVDGYGKTEVIKSIEAYTYNLQNGRLIRKEVKQSGIFEEKVSEHWRRKKFVFPDVKEGSILEYRYILETPFMFNLPDWYFQDLIPTIYSQYTLRSIPFYEYIYIAQGITKFDYQNSEVGRKRRTWGNVTTSYGQNIAGNAGFQDYIHTFALKDVPAFKDEAFITSVNDYLIKMDFQLAKFYHPSGGERNIITTWPELNKALLKNELFGKYIKGCDKYAKKILENNLQLAGKTKVQQQKLIVEFVKNNFSWDGRYGKYTTKSPKEFFYQKTGNTADINLFLVSLLKNAGFNTRPVILSTRDHGKVKTNYPFAHFFNYVIALVYDDKPFLVDATEKLLPYNNIPPRCINEKGLIVAEKDVKWVPLSTHRLSITNHVINIQLDNAPGKVMLSIQSDNYSAYTYKKKYRNDTSAIKKSLFPNLIEISQVKTFNYDEAQRPYIVIVQGKAETESIRNKLIVSPFLNLAITKNKLTQKERTYPMDFIYAKADQFDITLNTPQGYKLFHLPEAYNVSDELVEIRVNYSTDGNIIKIKGLYAFKKPVYSSNEYAKVKFYINKIVEKFSEQLVFEKY